jgi:hypothetical protein
MWNSRKYAAAAIVGAGLAVAAALPASAWCPGYSGYYGAPYGYGAYGYSSGWPYASTGYTDYLSYGYSGCGAYDAAGWTGSSWGDDYGPTYGYAGSAYAPACGYGSYGYVPARRYAAYGYAPAFGYASFGGRSFRRPCGGVYGRAWVANRPRDVNYAVAYRHPAGNAVAAARLRPSAVAVNALRSDRHVHAAARHPDFAQKPAAQNKTAYRVQTVKLAHND